MKQALALSRKALGKTYPNPLVGAIVVDSCGKKIGAGYHQRAGEAHAEVWALEQAGGAAKGSTLYVTLEPCCHQGRTPPCTKKIITSGIKRVVVAMEDPNPLVSGRGISELRAAGIQVEVGIQRSKAIRLNQVFIKWITEKKCFVTAKVALTKDFVLGSNNQRLMISDPMMESKTMKLRAQAGALLVGVHTVISDNPRLNIRGRWNNETMIRIILDPSLRTPPDAKLFESKKPVWIIYDDSFRAPKEVFTRLSRKARLIPQAVDAKRQFNLAQTIEFIEKNGICSILIEGGMRTLNIFHRQKLIDVWTLYVHEKTSDVNLHGLIHFDLDPPFHLSIQSAIRRAHDWEIVGKHVYRDH